MDDVERAVLKRRRGTMADMVHVTTELLQDLKSADLIGHKVIYTIELEKTNQAKVFRLVDSLLTDIGPPDAFSRLCTILAKSYRRLSRDMEVEIRIEKGDVTPLPEILEEAAAVVHRKFGQSKRFSHADKKELTELIATKLQLSRDEWHRDMAVIQHELEQSRESSHLQSKHAEAIRQLFTNFIQTHERQLTSLSHGMATTSEIVRHMAAEVRTDAEIADDESRAFVDSVESFMKHIEVVLQHRESMTDERERSLALLGIKEVGTRLDVAISRCTGRMLNGDMTAEDKDTVIERLRRQVNELETTIRKHDAAVYAYKKHIGQQEREIADLRRQVKS